MEKSRLEFVNRVLAKEKSKSSLCREYGISRVTGDKWIRRYMQGKDLSNYSRRPSNSPNKTPEHIEKLILDKRKEHPAWGPRKIKRNLENLGFKDIPSKSTVGNILKRNNFIEIKETMIRKKYKRFERSSPNELWQTDFKGHFNMDNNKRCHPLTVLDDHSRFSLCIDAKHNERYDGVYKSFCRIFNEYGLPEAILCDNGNPWADSKLGYTLFEIWLMQLNILPIHGRPYHPQTQGKEERFHRTLKKELLEYYNILDYDDAQTKFDWWRHIYNHERPHDALNLEVPASRYAHSNRKLPSSLKEPEYNSLANVIKVNTKGYLNIYNRKVYFSESFSKKYLELTLLDNDLVSINYGNFQLALFDLYENLFTSKKIKRKGTVV